MNLNTTCRKLLFHLVVAILLFGILAQPPVSSALQEATLSIDPPSETITDPTYTINVKISSVTNLWAFHFQLSFNNGTDFLLVDIPGGVEPGDLMTAQATVDSNVASIDGISYLDVTVLAPNWENNGTITGEGSVAKVTFRLRDDAQPGMTSWLKLETADATVYTGSGFEQVNMTLGSGYWVKLGMLTTLLKLKVPGIAFARMTNIISANLTDSGGNPIAGQKIDFYIDSFSISGYTNASGIASMAYVQNEPGTVNVEAVYEGSLKYSGSKSKATLTLIDPIWLWLLLIYWLLSILFGF